MVDQDLLRRGSRKALAIILAMLLSGCAAGGHPLDCMTGLVAWSDCAPGTKGYLYHQQSLQAQPVAAAPDDPQQQQDDATCKSYGTLPGTDAYVNCRLKLHDSHAAQPTPR
jgi:hypothetical protein